MADNKDKEEKEEQEPKGSGKEEQEVKEPGKETPEKEEKKTDTVSLSEFQEMKNLYENLKSSVETENEEKLKEKEDFKTLYQQEKEKNTAKDELIKDKELQLAAKEHLKDPKDILFFKNRFKFDQNLNITNSKEVLEEIKKEKPYLFKEEKGKTKEVPKTETGKVPLDLPAGHIFSRSEIKAMSRDEYKKHKKEIMRQMEKNLIIDDIKEEK